MQNRNVSVTIENPTAAQIAAMRALLGSVDADQETTVASSRKKRGKPADTVSEDEEEDFGKKKLSKKKLKADAEDESEDEDGEEDAEESEDEDGEEDAEESEDEDSEEDEEEGVSFDEVKAAINKYGEKKPDEMKAILAGFNIKSTKQLEGLPKKWDAVYRKVQAKLTAKKKKAA